MLAAHEFAIGCVSPRQRAADESAEICVFAPVLRSSGEGMARSAPNALLGPKRDDGVDPRRLPDRRQARHDADEAVGQAGGNDHLRPARDELSNPRVHFDRKCWQTMGS